MQYILDPVSLWSLIGIALSIIFVMVFQSSLAASKGISSVPTTYAIGALIAFSVGMIYIIGLEIPLHSWIGLVGGYLLLSLSIIQALFDVRTSKSYAKVENEARK